MSECPAKDQIRVTVSGPCVLQRKEAACSFSVAFKSPQRPYGLSGMTSPLKERRRPGGGVAVTSDVHVVSTITIVVEVADVVEVLPRSIAAAPLATAGGEVSLGSAFSGSSAAGSGGV